MQRFMMVFILVLLPVLTLALPQPGQAQEQPPVRCFETTGYCIEGVMLTYWERSGGLSTVGYPITEQSPDTTVDTWSGPVQWFERTRLEDHGPQGVLAGRLGVELLALQGRPWQYLPTVFHRFPHVRTVSELEHDYGCLYFEATMHSLCPPFRAYWEEHGGVDSFGYPISEPMMESIGDWAGTVQYFERHRMEFHHELRGTAFEIQTGRIGTEVLTLLQKRDDSPVRNTADIHSYQLYQPEAPQNLQPMPAAAPLPAAE
ncbi:MAG: hypothetical protein HC837_03730 [Chloroflexaceae bacterium]|nr:hypothetical protein [Chloroflexaceae bacterium]